MSSLIRAVPVGNSNLVDPYKLPIGSKGQTLMCNSDGSTDYIPQYTCKFINVATTTEELAELLLLNISYETAVDDWYKFSHLKHGTSPDFTTAYPSIVDDVDISKWEYDSNTLTYKSSADSFTGVVSSTFHDYYTMEATLSSTGNSSNTVAVILAFLKDTDKEHTLSLVRSGGGDVDLVKDGIPVTYGIVYNYKQEDEQIIAELSVIETGIHNWSIDGNVNIRVVRTPTLIKVYTSLFGVSTIEDLTEIVVELDKIDVLNKFINQCQYGFGSFKQENSKFSINSLTNSKQIFIDKQSKFLYEFNYSSNTWIKKIHFTKSRLILNGSFVYSVFKKRLFYITKDDIIQVSQDIIPPTPPTPYVPRDYLEPVKLIAYHAIQKGQLVMVSNLGQAAVADKRTKKAIGIALHSCNADEEVLIQVYGVFYGFDFLTIPKCLGEIYYQDDNGRVALKDTPITFKYPALIAISPDSVLIIPDTNLGGSGGSGGPVTPGTGTTTYIDNVKVRREETVLNATANELEEVLKAEDIFIKLFGAANWSTQEYMLKQYLIVRNKDTIANLDIRLTSDSTDIKELIFPNSEIFFPIYKTDWKISVQGNYEIKSIFEIISTALPTIIVDPSEVEEGWETQPIIDSNGESKVIVLGQIKKFNVTNSVESLDDFTLLLDLKQWILDTVDSEDYMILSNLSIINLSIEDVANIEIRSNNTVVSEFILPIAQSVLLDVHREDVSIYCKGNVKIIFNAQVTAYKFKV